MELVGEPEPKRPRVEIAPPECYFCLETIFPCEQVHQSWCRPVPHFSHRRCWSVLENPVCGICRREEPRWSEIILAIGASGHRVDFSKDYQPEELPPLARALMSLRMNGEMTYEELWIFFNVCMKLIPTQPSDPE